MSLTNLNINREKWEKDMVTKDTVQTIYNNVCLVEIFRKTIVMLPAIDEKVIFCVILN